MAINPNIPLQGRNFDFVSRYQQGQQNRLQQEIAEAEQQRAQQEGNLAQQETQRNQLIQALGIRAAQGDQEAQTMLSGIAPDRSQGITESQQAQQEQVEMQEAQGAMQARSLLQSGDAEGAVQTLRQLPESRARNQAMAALQAGDTERAGQMLDSAVQQAVRMGRIEEGQQPVKLGQGSRLVNPQSGEVVAQGGARRPPTGRYQSEVDQFGNVSVIDTTTGEVVRGGGQQRQPTGDSPSRPSGQGDVYSAVEEGTGPVASMRAGINAVIGPFLEGVPFDNTNRARASIRNFNQEAKTALVNNPRFPVAEQEVVQRMLPNPEQFFQDPDAARQELDQLRTFLLNKREQNQQSIQSGSVTEDEVGDLSNQVEAINRVIGLMGPPEGGQGGQSGEGQVIDFNDLPE